MLTHADVCTAQALLRPGRFDRKVPIDLPTMQDRVEILAVHLRPLKTAEDKAVIAARLSALTAGCSGGTSQAKFTHRLTLSCCQAGPMFQCTRRYDY